MTQLLVRRRLAGFPVPTRCWRRRLLTSSTRCVRKAPIGTTRRTGWVRCSMANCWKPRASGGDLARSWVHRPPMTWSGPWSRWRRREVQHGHWPCLGQSFGQLACRDSPPVWLEVGVLRGVVRALALPWVVLFFAGMMSCGGVAHPDGCAALKWHGRERRSQGSKHSWCAACWPWWLRCWTSECPALQ